MCQWLALRLTSANLLLALAVPPVRAQTTGNPATDTCIFNCYYQTALKNTIANDVCATYFPDERAEFTCICRTPTLLSGTRLCAAGACAAGTVQIIDQVCQDLTGGGTLPPGLGTTAGGGNPLSSIGTGAASPAPAPVQTGSPAAAAAPPSQSPGAVQNGQQGTGAGDSGGPLTVLNGSAATWKRHSKFWGVVAVCIGLVHSS